jgi:hypothetical protein
LKNVVCERLLAEVLPSEQMIDMVRCSNDVICQAGSTQWVRAKLYLPERLPMFGMITLASILALVCRVVAFVVKGITPTVCQAHATLLGLGVLTAKM